MKAGQWHKICGAVSSSWSQKRQSVFGEILRLCIELRSLSFQSEIRLCQFFCICGVDEDFTPRAPHRFFPLPICVHLRCTLQACTWDFRRFPPLGIILTPRLARSSAMIFPLTLLCFWTHNSVTFLIAASLLKVLWRFCINVYLVE